MKNVSSDTKKSRGRPARLEHDAGVVIAERLFHEIGYDQLGVAAICDALGVRQPALYRVFGSKAGLYQAALDRYLESPFATFIGQEAEVADTADALAKNILLRAADIYTFDEDRKGCLVLETAYGSADDTARCAAMSLVEQTREVLRQRLEGMEVQDAAARADAIILVLRGLSSEARAGRSRDDLQMALRSMFKSFV